MLWAVTIVATAVKTDVSCGVKSFFSLLQEYQNLMEVL